MKKPRVILWIVVGILTVTVFIWWQVRQLGRSLQTINAVNANEVLLSAMSAEVLAPNVDVDGQHFNNTSEPLLDQYRKTPNLVHQRYLLVMTWVHASEISRAIDWSPFNLKMIGSDSLSSISPESRVDGWRNPFCILVQQNQVVFISSGGNGTPNCSLLQRTAAEASVGSHDARLTRVGSLLVTVQGRSADITR
jgi:hypothetical protein